MTNFIDELWKCIVDTDEGLIHKQHLPGYDPFNQMALLKEVIKSSFDFREEKFAGEEAKKQWQHSLKVVDNIKKEQIAESQSKQQFWSAHVDVSSDEVRAADILISIVIYPGYFIVVLEWFIEADDYDDYYDKSGLICDCFKCSGTAIKRVIDENAAEGLSRKLPETYDDINFGNDDIKSYLFWQDATGNLLLRKPDNPAVQFGGSVLYSITANGTFVGDEILILVFNMFSSRLFEIQPEALSRWKKLSLIDQDTTALKGEIGLIRRDVSNLRNFEFLFQIGGQTYSYSVTPAFEGKDKVPYLGVFTDDVEMLTRDEPPQNTSKKSKGDAPPQKTSKKAKVSDQKNSKSDCFLQFR